MKRLWMRLGLLAGIVATGGAGVLVAQRGSTEPETEIASSEEQNAPPPAPTPQPIAFGEAGMNEGDLQLPRPAIHEGEDQPGYGSPAAVQPAAEYESLDGGGATGGLPPEPTRVSVGDWQDAPPPDPTQPEASGGYNGQPLPVDSTYAPRYANTGGGEPMLQPPPAEFDTGGPAAASISSDPPGPVADQELLDVPAGPASPATESVPPIEPEYALEGRIVEGPASPPIDSTTALPPLRPQIGSADGSLDPSELGSSEESPQDYSPDAGYIDPQVAPPAQPTLSVPAATPQYPMDAGGVVATVPAAAALASDRPGDRELEGLQTPKLTLEKRAPSEVSVGQEAAFEVIVRNIGEVTARGVVVTDRVPQGARLVDTSPEYSQTPDGAMAWQLGDIEPGDRATITINLMPESEGEIGSVAQLSFQTQASARTVSTKPGLVIKHDGPAKALIGEAVLFKIVISNPGSGDTTGIVIEEDVPEGLAHVAGNALEYEVGTLRPGDERKLELILKADKAGLVRNVLRAKADGGLQAADEAQLEVIAPALQVGIGGPGMRYLDREVSYEIGFVNPGTATAYDIQFVARLPRGLKFVSASDKGKYDSRNHAVYWSLAELPAQESGSVTLTALPTETGGQTLTLRATGDLELESDAEHTLNVEGLTKLAFTVQDTKAPIELGKETTYEVRIANNGNKAATNVQVGAVFPAELTPLKGDGSTRVTVDGQQVFMAPIAKIEPRDEVVYRITARGLQVGDHPITVQLVSDEESTPVIKQANTKVYADQ